MNSANIKLALAASARVIVVAKLRDPTRYWYACISYGVANDSYGTRGSDNNGVCGVFRCSR
jgi:hypothetical protein